MFCLRKSSQSSAPHSIAPLLPDKGAGPSRGGLNVSFKAPEEDKMSIAASEEGLSSLDVKDSAEQSLAVVAAQKVGVRS